MGVRDYSGGVIEEKGEQKPAEKEAAKKGNDTTVNETTFLSPKIDCKCS